MVAIVIFWILFILCCVSLFVTGYPLVGFGMLLVLIGILGLKTFGNPFA